MVLMCAIAWMMRYCEADKWVRLKSPNKHTEELVWYGIDCLQPLLSQNGSCLFLRILKDYFKLPILKQPFFCGSFWNLDQRGSNLLTTCFLMFSGGADAVPRLDPLSQSCRYLPPPPGDRFWWHWAAAARGIWVFHLSCSSHHLNSPIILWFRLSIAFGWGNERQWVIHHHLSPLLSSHLNWKREGIWGKFMYFC
jgi:hypothetical protein